MFQLILLKKRLINNAEETANDKKKYAVYGIPSTFSSLRNAINYEEPSLESCSIIYFAGYLAKNYLDTFVVCVDCDLTKNNECHKQPIANNFNTP